jgi:integrase
MSVYKRGDIWWYRFKFRGDHVRLSSKSKNKNVCERLEREHRRKLELNQGGLIEIARPKQFSVAARAYLQDREAHWAPKTRIVHAGSLKHLEPHFGKLLLSDITADDIHRYQAVRKREQASGRTINIEVSLLRLVLRKHRLWAAIADDVQMLKENRDVGRELADDEVDRLFTAAKASASRSLYPAIVVSIHTGLRNEELRLLRWSQIDLLEGNITVGKSKTEGGEGRVVPLSKTGWNVLKVWRSQFPNAMPSHAVWPRESYGLIGKKGTFGGKVAPYETFPNEPIGSWKSAWQQAKNNANVRCRWHDLRHSFISRIAAGGATDGTIQSIAGWMSPKMIERYSHVRNAAKRQAVAILDLEERAFV